MFEGGEILVREQRPARATMLDVARLAEVSHQTVSRYFRARDGLKPATRDKVAAAVTELKYRPNPVAQSMRTRQTGRLAIVLPTLSSNPVRLLAGASAAARESGYAIDVMSYEGSAEGFAERVVYLADSRQVDGILCFGPLSRDFRLNVRESTALVLASGFDDEMRGMGEIADASAVGELIRGLKERGHQRFLHVSGALEHPAARARHDAYLRGVQEFNVQSVGVVEAEWTAEAGERAMLDLSLDEAPTAVLAGNDLAAAGVIRGAMQRGLRTPEDISVTGWDNLMLGRYLFPSLTTVDVDLYHVGSRAMARLVAAARGEDFTQPEAGPLTRVIWRESVAEAPPS